MYFLGWLWRVHVLCRSVGTLPLPGDTWGSNANFMITGMSVCRNNTLINIKWICQWILKFSRNMCEVVTSDSYSMSFSTGASLSVYNKQREGKHFLWNTDITQTILSPFECASSTLVGCWKSNAFCSEPIPQDAVEFAFLVARLFGTAPAVKDI